MSTAAPKVKKAPSGKPPTTLDMIVSAIVAIKDPKGASIAAIKKYIIANYDVDATRLTVRMRRAIVRGLETGVIVRAGNMSSRFKVVKAERPKAAPKKKKIAVSKPKAAVEKSKSITKDKVKKAPKKADASTSKVDKDKVKAPKKAVTKKVVAKKAATKPKVAKKPAAKKVAKA